MESQHRGAVALDLCEHVFDMVVCVLIPRFSLLAAVEGGRGSAAALLAAPVALGPQPGGVQAVGEVTPAAEAFGVTAGMRMGEALARCPELRLVPPDPDTVCARWSGVLDRLERIGAAPESDRAGEAHFEADGLHAARLGPERDRRGQQRRGRAPAVLHSRQQREARDEDADDHTEHMFA